MVRTYRAVGVVTMFCGLYSLGSELPFTGFALTVVGLVAIVLAGSIQEQQKWMALRDAAHRAWCGGRASEARHTLQQIPQRDREGVVGLAAFALLAAMANADGETARARAHAEDAIACSRRLRFRLVAFGVAENLSAAHGERAIAAAHEGDAGAVLAELAWVDGTDTVAPSRTARARIYFAAAIIATRASAEKAPTTAAARAAIERAWPFVAYLARSERDALRAMRGRAGLAADTYRVQPPRALMRALEGELAHADLRVTLPAETRDMARARLAAGVASVRAGIWGIALPMGLLVTLVATSNAIAAAFSAAQHRNPIVYEKGNEDGRRTREHPAAPRENPRLPLTIVALGGMLLLAARGRQRAEEEVQRAEAFLACESGAEGARALDALAAAPLQVTRAHALTARAWERERKSDFAGALADAEAALAACSRSKDDAAQRAQAGFARAMSLAVIGKKNRDAELLTLAAESLEEGESGHTPNMDAHRFRVMLVLALATGAWDRAARIARARPAAMQLPYRDDALADLMCQAHERDGDALALLAELEASPMTYTWVAAVAPELLHAVRTGQPLSAAAAA